MQDARCERPRQLRLLAVCALALATAVAFPARAGVPLRDDAGLVTRWDLDVEQPNVSAGRILWFLDPLTSQEEPPGDETERDAITAAALAWESAPGSGVRFLEDPGRPAYVPKAKDRVNYLGWKAFVLSPLTLAATYTTSSNGVITDSDIVFNDTTEFVLWSTESPGLAGYADVQALATHQLGHLLGLDHTPVATATMAAVQFTGTVSSRSLQPDDVGALLDVYPETSLGGVGSIIGTLRVGRSRAPAGIPVFALDARTGAPAGSAFTDPLGLYRIRGLPPGPYRVAAAPLASTGPYSAWWAEAPLGLRAGFLEEELPGGVRVPATVFVRPGFPEVGKDFAIRRVGKRAVARPDRDLVVPEIRLGGGAAGVFEEPGDADWFVIPTDGFNAFDVRVHGWGLGSSADVEVAILSPGGGTVLASNIDRRSPVDPVAFHGLLGVDLDAAIEAFVPPSPGDYLVRVRAQPGSETARAGAFYLLEVVPSAGVPDPRRTVVSLSPASTRVDGGPAVTISAVPKDFFGDPLGAGAFVTAFRSDTGDLFELTDLETGTYAAAAAAPAVTGEVRFTLTVEAPRGTFVLPDAAILQVAGTADAAASTLDATPRRVEADGASPATLIFTPRDASGRALGPGLAAAFVFDGPPAGNLGPAKDLGDGRYSAAILAPSAPGSARVSVTLDGLPTGVTRLVGFGWDLSLVAADLGAEVVEAQGKPGVSRHESEDFGRAGETLDGVLEGMAGADEPGAAAAAARAVRALLRAGRSPRFPGGTAASGEILEALRRRAHGLIDAVVPPVPDDGTLAILEAAGGLLDRAESALDAGNGARAARLFAAAVRRAGPLL